ncbi:glycosyltransferase family 4 protein [Rapidithrix thailandica]|uniref:Glycosyltransferase family 4 protein n=1 Tax=Rapidithrix thailandica TaxID=413964 RepID=A0AAW9S2G8_9BACT
MRIAMFSWESLHSISVGGVAVHVTELAAALQRRGHEVHVFTRPSFGNGGWGLIDGVYYHFCPFDLHPDFVQEVNNMCRSFVQHFFETENVSGHFDVVHAHDWLSSNAAVWAKEERHKKMVMTVHSTEYGRCGNQFHNHTSAMIRDHERHGTFCANRVITVSHTLQKEISWMYEVPEQKVSTIYNGVHAAQFDGWIHPKDIREQIGVGPLDPMALFVGRMSVQKGPDILVRAIPMVLHFHPGAKFVFVGDGAERSYCEHLANQLGIEHAVRFLGYRNGNFLKNLFKSSDLVVVPSRNEPFGIVVLEAWSAGKPVVATHNGGPSEFVSHGINGYKIYDHPESVAWGIGTMFADFDHARTMGRNGRSTVESVFTWDKIAEHTEGVYHCI